MSIDTTVLKWAIFTMRVYGGNFSFFPIQMKFGFWPYKKRWYTSWKFQLEIRSNKKVIAKKPLTNLYGMNSNTWNSCDPRRAKEDNYGASSFDLTLKMLGIFFKKDFKCWLVLKTLKSCLILMGNGRLSGKQVGPRAKFLKKIVNIICC